MKIQYFSDMRLPTEKAHGLQILKTCEALAKLGNEICLVIPSWNKNSESEIFDYYDMPKTFAIEKIKAVNPIRLGKIGFVLRSFFFAKSSLKYLKNQNPEVVYTRDENVGIRMSKAGYKVFYEMHDVRKNAQQLECLKQDCGTVVISEGLKKYCQEKGIDEGGLLVAADGVDLQTFSLAIDKIEAKKKVGFSDKKKTVLYSGHLYSWKGADVLADAAKLLSEEVEVIFIGGTPWDLESFKAKYAGYGNIKILGHKKHSEIPFYLKAADLLVLPNSAKTDISRLYTSPVKLFEYMSSGTPIVASDLPSIREILNDNNAFFAKADDAVSLANSINFALDNEAKAAILSHQALQDVAKYSWQNRARKISEFVARRI